MKNFLSTKQIKPRKILYIASGRSFQSQNPGRKIHSVVQCFMDMKHDVCFVGGGDILYENSMKVHNDVCANEINDTLKRRLPGYFVHSFSEYRDIIHNKRLFDYLVDFTKNWQPDIIWERSSRLHSAGIELAAFLNIPFVLEWKDNPIRYKRSYYHNRALELEKYKFDCANWVVVESEALVRELSGSANSSGKKLIVAQNAVDPEEFFQPSMREKMRNLLDIDDKTYIVGYVGSFAWYHHVELLCDVVDILRNRNFNEKCRFFLLGDGAGKADFEKYMYELGLEEWFVFLGRVKKEEVPKYLAAFDAAVLPGCTNIICPIKVQEYMAAELPALVPDYAPNREVIQHEENGLLFNPNDADSLAENVVKIISDKKLRSQVAKKARKTVLDSFTWEKTWGVALNHILSNTFE